MTDAPFEPFAYAHARFGEIAWMCQNTNHLVPREVVEPAMLEAIRERRYTMYPQGKGDPELLDLVRKDFGLAPADPVILTAGGTEALYMLERALFRPGDEMISSDPGYPIIHRFAELAGANVRALPIYAPPYRLDLEKVKEAIGPKTRILVLIDPLNPLGSGYSREEVRSFADLAHDHRIYLLNDVTYRDFPERHTLAREFAPEQTITVWSVSKNCGLAGMRLGGLMASPDLASTIGRFHTNDLGVDVVAQWAARSALRTKATWLPAVRRQTRENAVRIREVVATVEGASLPVFPSQANMFPIDLAGTGIRPEAIQEEMLLRDGVFVRSGGYVSPLFGHRFIRVSFSNPPSDIERFARSFPAAVARLRAPTARAA
ncbi:MAG: pyridoxal phosphate-dependent aminotransferase [Candidatus Thermoplasmatota archaeon]|jgi:aspartate/methionine/tyrosine aminotransferase|nr:pyridoxal phosphate-dependent aminotransferase [Candidatus Thermoplasmatota archaeon]MCL5983538.1 pyridoxal phosphate-dependent aminotransferase [Candidatus Thermoplasmatota archaeon]